MNREDKHRIVQDLAERIKDSGNNFYITDIGGMTVNDSNELRKVCYEEEVHLQVVKNKLVLKALEQLELTDAALIDTLKGETSIMIASNFKAPAKLIKKASKEGAKPVMKAAFVQEALFVGHDQLGKVLDMKSKEEVLGEIVTALQTPARQIVAALMTPAQKLAGILSLEGEGTLAGLGKKQD